MQGLRALICVIGWMKHVHLDVLVSLLSRLKPWPQLNEKKTVWLWSDKTLRSAAESFSRNDVCDGWGTAVGSSYKTLKRFLLCHSELCVHLHLHSHYPLKCKESEKCWKFLGKKRRIIPDHQKSWRLFFTTFYPLFTPRLHYWLDHKCILLRVLYVIYYVINIIYTNLLLIYQI